MKKLLIPASLVLSLAACVNMPTEPAQITGSYISPTKYKNYNCSELSNELNSLSRRENQLIKAQEQRIKTSEVQSLWRGFGTGDGMEATELANVRGEREAVITMMEQKQCTGIPERKK